MSDVLISVVIPTYQRNDLLAKCLACLAPGTQTMDALRYEVIVTDDGKSTTAEKMVVEQFPWARWVKGPQRGPAANRNNGAKYARGQWIAFTDDDCLPSAGWLEKYADAIEPDIQIYEGKTTCIDGCIPIIEEAPINLTGGLMWSCNLMIERATFNGLGGFDDSYPYASMEDIDFLERVHLHGIATRFISDALIDHPPRSCRLGIAAGKVWESRVFFIYKFNRRLSVCWWLPLHLMKIRTISLLRNGITWNTLIGAASFAVEFAYVLAHSRSWERKYSKGYKSK